MFGFYETSPRLRVKALGVAPGLPALLDAGAVALMWQTPAGHMLDAYGAQLLAAIRARKVKRLFIDGLTSFKNAAADPARIGRFFSALANELRMLGVTTLYSLEVPDILGPVIRVPVDDVLSLAENMILLRYVELRSKLYRLISVLKVRDHDFDPSLFEYTIGPHGLDIKATSASAETLLADLGGSGRGFAGTAEQRRATRPARSLIMAVVLVVDDEFGITDLLEDVLSDEGHRVLAASNGKQALERAAAERPDLVLTDYMIPVMDGVALIAANAGLAPRTVGAPSPTGHAPGRCDTGETSL